MLQVNSGGALRPRQRLRRPLIDLRDHFSRIESLARPRDQLHPSVEMLDDRSAAVDPITAIDINDPLHLPYGCRVNVTADHTAHSALAPMPCHGCLEVEDEAHCALDLALLVTGQRPIPGHTERATQP